ncbi:MAG: NAD(P)/FAD-dependent oxidoreductase [Rhabdochlamydiaceae bacterium]
MSTPRVIVIGGGFGGLNLIKSLKNKNVRITLIDKTNHHLFQPLLYQVATSSLFPTQIASPLRDFMQSQQNLSVIMGEVIRIDKIKKIVVLQNGNEFSYDYLVVATGTTHSYFGHKEWENWAVGLKTLSDAVNIRDKILTSFETAELEGSLSGNAPSLNFAVIGGGPTGVEMAGAISEICRESLKGQFKYIKPETSAVYLIEAASRILPTYPEKCSSQAKKDLEKLGVKVLLNTKVLDISKEGINLGDLFLSTQNIIWAAGNQASSFLKTLDTPLDKCGRVIVESDLSIPGEQNVFVIGDASHVKTKEGALVPGVAPAAIQEGKYVAQIISQKQKARQPFVYFDKGSMATIGKGKAIACKGSLQLGGFIAWLAWCFIHILYLVGFKNRLAVMWDWMYTFATGKRKGRIIYNCVSKNRVSEIDNK